MPAYIHHHDAEPPFIICPSCVGLPMCVKAVAPHWSMAKIDLWMLRLRSGSATDRDQGGFAEL